MSTCKSGCRAMLDEYLSDFDLNRSFDYNIQNGSITFTVIKACESNNHKSQKKLNRFDTKKIYLLDDI